MTEDGFKQELETLNRRMACLGDGHLWDWSLARLAATYELTDAQVRGIRSGVRQDGADFCMAVMRNRHDHLTKLMKVFDDPRFRDLSISHKTLADDYDIKHQTFRAIRREIVGIRGRPSPRPRHSTYYTPAVAKRSELLRAWGRCQ